MEFSSLNFKVFYIEEQLKHLAMIFGLDLDIERLEFPEYKMAAIFKRRGISPITLFIYPDKLGSKDEIDNAIDSLKSTLEEGLNRRKQEAEFMRERTELLKKSKAYMDYMADLTVRKRSIPSMPKIKKVIFNNPATIVFWSDGTKTVVKAQDEEFDKDKGLAMAIAKKALGNQGNYFEEFKKWL